MSGSSGGPKRGVVATGNYLPRFRLDAEAVQEAWGSSAGVSSARVPAADEDALTMAIAAAETALEEADEDGIEAADLAYLGIATTTPPVEEGAFASRAVRALGLSGDARTEAATQDTAAGADVLAEAATAEGPALAVATDAPKAEPGTADAGMGAGAAAFLFADLDGGSTGAPTLVDRADHADEYPGVRFRRRGSLDVESIDITTYERGAITESVASAAGRLSVDPEAVTGVAVHQPTPKLAGRIAGALPFDGVERQGQVANEVGDAGAAGVPLALLDALAGAGPEDVTVAAFFGGGARAVALAFEGGGTAAAPDIEGGESLSYSRYLRERGHVVSGEVAGGGAHVSLPTWRQSLDARYRLAAGRCRECGALTFPAEGACRRCGARDAFDRVELPREGRVAANTVIGQGGAPPEFGPLQERGGAFGVAVVEFELDGETVSMPAQLTDVDPTAVEIGDRVGAVVRRIYEQEGVARYGAKFVPV